MLVAIALLAFSARRVLFLFAALPSPPSNPSADLRSDSLPPSVLLLLPCRNEARSLPTLLTSIEQLNYPPERLTAVIVDDGSSDETAHVARAWADGKAWAHLLSLPANLGKPAALNEGLAYFPDGDLIAVYDCDCRPSPDSLLTLVRAFDDPRVGAANGFLLALNSLASLAAYYASVEHLVHQRITSVAKDRLNLAPAILGSNCLYRREALKAAGYFRTGLLLEDSNLTLGLALVGYRTRFIASAVAYTSVPQSLAGYWEQHIRWARGFQQVAGLQARAIWIDSRLTLPMRLELLAFALGYADRLALLGAGTLTVLDWVWPGLTGFPVWLWPVYFGLALAQIIFALALSPRKSPARMYLYVIAVPFFFVLDVSMAAWSALQALLHRPARWTVTERPLAQTS